mmetsp:Transcript_25448/g.61183  ORF Transcript_25448/g.61183 Transcript_25448/m.61183 type:complete len:92 (-) Transcript_25448:1046-1321(-)
MSAKRGASNHAIKARQDDPKQDHQSERNKAGYERLTRWLMSSNIAEKATKDQRLYTVSFAQEQLHVPVITPSYYHANIYHHAAEAWHCRAQ